MSISTLDLRCALVVIDLQKGIVSAPRAHPTGPVVQNAQRLARAFRGAQLPVVLVNVLGMAPGRTEAPRPQTPWPADFSDLIPELEAAASDHLVSKRTWGAFTHTDLLDYLRERQISQVVLAGIATSIGVESTARQAHEFGFNVVLATDAMTDASAEAHENTVTRIFPRLGESGTTADIIGLLKATRA